MSYAEEFKSQWSSLERKLDSEMILSYKRDGMLRFERVSKLLENEKARWTHGGEYNCAWLNKLRKEKPEVAGRFESALGSVRFAQQQSASGGTPLVAAGTAVGGGAVGFMLMKLLLHRGVLLTILGTLLLAGLGGSLGYSLIYMNKLQNAQKRVREAYVQQLHKAGEMLAKIVEQADH